MPDLAHSITDYLASWNEADPRRRAELIAAVWCEDGRYVDAMSDARGHQQIEAMITEVWKQLPGNRLSLVGEVQSHHDVARFSWQLGPADGPPLFSGVDLAVFDSEGRLRELIGFWDESPAS